MFKTQVLLSKSNHNQLPTVLGAIAFQSLLVINGKHCRSIMQLL